jgi:hypothetical protein
MMNKFIKAFCLTAVLSIAAVAQTNNDEYNKNEFYVGYSNQQVGNSNRSTFNGIEGSYTRNINRWFGIRGTVSYAKRDRTFEGSLPLSTGGNYSFQQTSVRSIANFLGGIQIKDNASTKRLKPFGFALGGVALNRSTFKNLACTSGNCPTNPAIANNVTFRDTGLAGSFGGGLDIKITKRIDLRAIQVDYNPVYSDSRVDNNFRFGIGVVFK